MERKQQALLARALTAAANATLIADREGRIVWVNDAFCHMSGDQRDELIGQTPHLLSSGLQPVTFYRDLWQRILSGQPWQGELTERRKDGRCYTVSQVITPIRDDKDVITHFVAIQHGIPITDRERQEIQRLAFHDSLTGLPNRVLFLDLLRQAITQAEQQKRMLALMFLDLDRFKDVNDQLGHAVGDKLLISVAERLEHAVRKSDVVARLSGDEFAVLVTHLDQPTVVDTLAAELVETVSQPFSLDGHTVGVEVSIGISLYPRDGLSADDLLQRADSAMYRAKQRGGRGYSHYGLGRPAP